MKIDLIKWFYIESVDTFNWQLKQAKISTKGKMAGQEYIVKHWYFATLKGAWITAIDRLSLEAEDFTELVSIIDRLEELKSNI